MPDAEQKKVEALLNFCFFERLCNVRDNKFVSRGSVVAFWNDAVRDSRNSPDFCWVSEFISVLFGPVHW